MLAIAMKCPHLSILALLCLCPAVCMGQAADAAANKATPSRTAQDPDAPVRFEEPQQQGTDAVAARLIELHLQARGGEDQLRQVQTLMLKGTLKEGLRESIVIEYYKAPDKFRRETYRQELGWEYLHLEATDGQVAWSQELMPVVKPAEALDRAARDGLMPAQYPYALLQDWQVPGRTFSYVGEVQAAGAPTFLVKTQLGERGSVYYYFDKQHMLPRDVGYTESMGGRPLELDRFPLRWRLVEGVRLETAYEVRHKGDLIRSVDFSEVRVNPELPDELFEMPEFREVWMRQLGRGEWRLEHRPGMPGEPGYGLPDSEASVEPRHTDAAAVTQD